MIEAGTGISILNVQLLEANASSGLEIKANGVTRVELTCTGSHSCDSLQLAVNQSKSVLITVNGTSASTSAYGANYANLTINNTDEVSINCITENACNANTWVLAADKIVTLTCNGDEACHYNSIYLAQLSKATIQVISGFASIQQNTIVMDGVNSLTIESPDNGIQNGVNTLRNVYRFLLNISGTGNAMGTSWKATNVSNVALNNWNATSYWLVDGLEIKNDYKCRNDSDCIIRVDETLDKSQPITISCPNVNQTNSLNSIIPKCVFYCTATITGCDTVRLFATNSPDVTLFLDSIYNTGFLLNADASGLNSTQKKINITCSSSYSCEASTFSVSGFTDVLLFCDSAFSCESAEFNISDFSNTVTILANSFAVHDAKLSLHSGYQVFIASQDITTPGQAFRFSHWDFRKIAHVFFACSYKEDCEEAVITGTEVNELSVVCGSYEHVSTDSCLRAKFHNNANSSFNLLCIGDTPCWNVEVEYDGDDIYDTSCGITCTINENTIGHATCGNMTVTVQNNQRGYDAIDLACETNEIYVSCFGVSVVCGESGFMCNCPVLYDTTADNWQCDGKCGTDICKKTSSSNKISAGATAGIVLSVLVVVGVLGYFTYLYVKRRHVESHLLSPSEKLPGKSVQTAQSYQTL